MARAALHVARMVGKNCNNGIGKCTHGHLSGDVICGCAGAKDGCDTIRDKSSAKPNPRPKLKQVIVDKLPTDLPISQQEILMLFDALKAEIDDLLAL